MAEPAKSASFALELSDLRSEAESLFWRDGQLSPEEREYLERMAALYSEAEATDVIRIGALGVLFRGEVSHRFPRRVRELIHDLENLIETAP